MLYIFKVLLWSMILKYYSGRKLKIMSMLENDQFEMQINSNLLDISNCNYPENSITYSTYLQENVDYLKMDEKESSKLMSLLKELNLSFLYQT